MKCGVLTRVYRVASCVLKKLWEVADHPDHDTNGWVRTARGRQTKTSREGNNGGRSAVRGSGVGKFVHCGMQITTPTGDCLLGRHGPSSIDPLEIINCTSNRRS